MPKMEAKFRVVSKQHSTDCINHEDWRKNDIQRTEVRNPLVFKQKIIKKMREGYRAKLKKSTRQWKSKFISFVNVRLQSYDQNCSSSSQFICPICLQMYMTPCPTSCGHIFCFRCIDQSIIRNPNCPTCRNFIRTDQFIESKSFSELNRHFWLQSKEKESYIQKYQKNEQWLKQRLIDKSNIQAHDLIDVKDTQYIWCKANVLCVYKGKDKTQVLVHFQGWNQIYNEVLNVNSQRLAPRNFFSERQDIPRYRLSSPEDNMRSRIEYRDYRDRNLNMNANLNTNVNVNNQIESEEESNNQPSNLMYRPVLNFRSNRSNPLTIRFNTRQGRDSIFAIRSLIQPSQDQQAEQNQQEHEADEPDEPNELDEHEDENEDENEEESESENQFLVGLNIDQEAQFQSGEQHPFMRNVPLRLQNEEILEEDSVQQEIRRQQQRIQQQDNNTPMSHHLNQRQQLIGSHQERNDDFDQLSVSNNSLGLDQFQNANQNLENNQENRQNQQVNSVSEYISLIDGDGNRTEQDIIQQQIRDTERIVRMLRNSRQQQNSQRQQYIQRDSQSEREEKQNSSQSNKEQEVKLKKKKMIQKSKNQQQKRKTKRKRCRHNRAQVRRKIPEQSTINLLQKSFQRNQ